jgi:predicted ATPase
VRSLPTGTVTFLFTDVEGSTKLLHELGTAAYAGALAEHRRAIRDAVGAHGGVEVDTQGDAFFIAFPTAPGALTAAAAARDALANGPIHARMGLHSGTPLVTEEGYVGTDVHRAARIAAAGHGGQILVSSSTAALADAELRDLGPHRLKDLSAPERIYQLGNGDFPPLKSLHQTNLPVPSTSFVGRERELPEVAQLLSSEDVRLLTLTGPGGTGKTRLGLQVAAQLAERYPDGVWWIPLASLRDPQLVLAKTGETLGAKGDVADHIGDRATLVLFDNFEHVVEAAGDIAQLLAACPRLEVLVTSREPLHVTGEQEYPVPPLAHAEGVGFFVARARAVAPDFEPDESVPEICRRLDELPLALELAAARVKALSPRQILERLERRLPLLTGGARDLPERQRTLRATIEWSLELLGDDERHLFNRLGVFNDGSRLEAAETVAEADVETLQSLVDKNLVRYSQERYWMLETIREYAAQFVDDEMRRRHATYFVALADESFMQLRGDPGDWLERLDYERANFRAAFEWLMDAAETQLALMLVGALGRFWYQHGDSGEGVRSVERALAADARPTPARARALHAAGVLLVPRDTTKAEARAAEAVELNRKLGDDWGVAYSIFLLAHIAFYRGDWGAAHERFTDSVEYFEAFGDEHFRLLATLNLAGVAVKLGDTQRGKDLIERVLRQARATGNKRTLTGALGTRAILERDEGRYGDALESLREAFALARETGERTEVPHMLGAMATVLAAAGQDVSAAQLFAKTSALHKQTGARMRSFDSEQEAKALEAVRARLDEATFERAWNEGLALSEEEALEHGSLARRPNDRPSAGHAPHLP